jgi:hypothetical protein
MKVEINYNKEKSGIELRFDAKVEGELKEQLRLSGFNYSSKYNCYWAAYAQGLMKYSTALQEALEKGESKAVVVLQPSYKPSEENLEQRNYSYVTVFYLEKGESESRVENYLVFEPKKNLAWLIAWEFSNRVYGDRLRQVMVEPRNYLKNARNIFFKNFEKNIIGLDVEEKKVPIKGKENNTSAQEEESKNQNQNISLKEKENQEMNEVEKNNQMKELASEESIAEKIEREDFVEHLEENIWDLIPQEDKKHSKIKPIEWKANPKDEGLQKLVANFVSHDELREAILGVYFDEKGIVATDAFKLLFLKTEQKTVRGIYCMSPSCWKNIRENVKDGEGLTELEEKKAEEYRKGKRGMYPDYQSVVNVEPKQIYSVDEEGLYGYVKTLKKAKIIRPKLFKVIIQAGSMLICLNGDFLEIAIRTLLSVGHKELEIGVIAPNKPIILAPAGNMEKARTLESDFVLLMPQAFDDDKIKNGELIKGNLYYDLEKMLPLTSGFNTAEKKNELSEKNEGKNEEKKEKHSSKNTQKGKSLIKALYNDGVFIPNVLIPQGVRLAFAKHNFKMKEMQAMMEKSFSDLLKIQESQLPSLDAVKMFELMQFAHPSDYGVNVGRGAMLEQWEERGEELFKELGLPTDEEYPFVNVYRGYLSVSPLGKLLSDRDSKQWWSAAESWRAIGDLEKAVLFLKEKIEAKNEQIKPLLNSSTKKVKDKNKEEFRELDWDIRSLKGGLELVENYLKEKGNPYAQTAIDSEQDDESGENQKGELSEEKKTSPKRKTQLSLNEEIEDFIVTRDNEGGGKYSEQDKQYISQYTGSGGLIKQGAQGKGILYEYYTPEDIVRKMWGLAYKYGYHDGKVLEPACGTGNFLKYAPDNASVTAYEINPTAVRIVEILYPHVTIYQRPFETNFFAGNIHLKGKYGGEKFDLIIGNPPYGDFSGKWAGMGEKQYTGATEYDQYFILRGLEMLNPGGLMVFIIPSNFLQNASKYNKVKEKISKLATLVDAYRLPTGVFNTTDIGTDIVVFKSEV